MRAAADRGGDLGTPSGGTGDPVVELLAELDSVSRALDLRGRMVRTPLATIAIAAGAGFVLGGGLFRPFAGRLVRTAARLALLPLAERVIVRLLTPQGADDAARAGGRDDGGEGSFDAIRPGSDQDRR